ncbi:MAG: phosphoribosylglycinamide formyltransferase, partial [Clostridiales bacterium]|nr:phosphoribosylglycinamide formyltransferase [Clostridiales bacterium]
MVRTAVLVSGDGTNLQSIINAQSFGKIKNCHLAAVISSRSDAFALTRAKNAGIPTYIVEYKNFPNRAAFNEAIYQKLKSLDIELVVLAGFMVVLGSPVIEAYENRIINIHPSLVPSFCGEGFYGIRVHEEALNYGVKISGATAHFATAVADAGP